MPCFDRLSERLLRAGIAPRHVRRYTRELSDHFDDLVREEIAGGASRALAETQALSRLGSEDNLAVAMLERPELRSFMARFPWAVFGVGPVALLASSVAVALVAERGIIDAATVWVPLLGFTPGPVAAHAFTQIMLVWNTLAIYGAPLLFAWLFYWMGSRQRMPKAWIITGVVLVCVMGGFQNLTFYDTGCKGCGHLDLTSGLLPPFPNLAEGLARAALNLTLAGSLWRLAIRRRVASAIALHAART
ncbi:MAG: hypothetical protein V4559_01440 [Pseudomonadota bacterium]